MGDVEKDEGELSERGSENTSLNIYPTQTENSDVASLLRALP